MWPLVALCCFGGLSLSLSLSPSAPQGRAGVPPGALSRGPTFASPALAAPPPLPDTTESKVEKLGRAFKRQVRRLRARSGRLELVFLVDESSSVGPANFLSELRFVKKLLSDFPVVPAATRVAIVTFSSRSNVVPRVDYISRRRPQQHKCALLGREIPAITYRGGGTYTKGAFQQAAQILRHARGNATKVIFLITDGYSNGGDPRPIAASLREFGVEIFTFGIWQGNIRELNDMASHPKEDHCYLLHSFTEFEALARRALHEDLPSGSYIQEDISHCSYLCEANENCCDIMASCKCGTHTGQFECICEKGYYGKGLQHECTACPPGTYKPEGSPGGISTCISCPDENHTSPPGSTSIEDCTCREGYHAVGQVCEVVHCPELKPPENGYFVQNVCNNYFNAACGIRCKAGFDLVGSSIRLCQPNGQWSGSEATCRVRTCPKLRAPENGHINCSTADISYKTVCFVTCNEGYEIEGNTKLTCQGTSQWDSKEPKCVEMRCPILQKLAGVTVLPLSCGLEPAVSGTVCQLSCPQGFMLIGTTEELRCLSFGRWSADIQKALCKDIEAPRIHCPENIETETLEHHNSANISWQVPTAEDNSGDEVSVHVTPAFIPPFLLPIGEVAITYTAADKSGNEASCTFSVKVIDAEAPVIDRCRSPPPIQAAGNETPATWEEPQFSDNSGAPLTVTRSHAPGDHFPKGETTVQYLAIDASGNNRTCEIHIVIKGSPCEISFEPVNGDFTCKSDEVGLNCTLQCAEGYSFSEGLSENYYCAYEDGVWKPPYSPERPTCSLNRFANHGFKSFEMLYKATRCDDNNLLNSFTDAFQSALGKMVPSFCNDVDDIDCRLEDQTQKHCLEYNYDYENGFAIGPAGWGTRNQLDYSYDDFVDVAQEDDLSKHLSASIKAAPARVKRHKMNVPMTDHKIKLIFNITASVPLPDERNDTLELENQRRLLKTLETITNRLNRTLNKEPMYSFQFASELIVADGDSLETEKAFLFCRPGSVLRGRMCVNCPVGTYYSLEHHTCESCWTGSYQDEEGQLECKSCPSGSYTEYLHSRSISECKAQCKQGTYSPNGLETCETCPLGTYQPTFGSRNCISCPENTSTVKRGAVDVSACGVPCLAGEFSRTGLTPCYPCPRDYYQPDPGKSYCLSCPFYGTTTVIGARSITDCSSFGSTFSAAEESIVMVPASPENISKQYKVSSQVFHECFLEPCHNNGTCKQLGSGYICLCPPGYTGLKCETEVDECKSSPCQNNGMCKDGIGTFDCHCQPGYSGLLCEEDINECSSSPCLNGAHCVDGKSGYHCTCAKGFTGAHCEMEINECLSNPCLNRAICEDRVGGFSCKCLPGFTGLFCEKNIDECLSRPCRNGATCRDGINNFRCLCVTGYTGLNCEVNINDCDSSPCLNQATCVDALNSYVCKCPPGFTGSRCETEQSSGFNLDFEVSGIYGYVMLDGVFPSLGDITCTFWMKSTDTTNYGTPISYAVENGSDNAFLLTDYNGWVLYVNGKERITDCPSVNDGNWHHIAVTWTCTDGAWKVYIDGKLSDGGSGLSVGSKIPGGGALALGQEQDQKGEGFNPAESFVGSISQLNIWDHVLSPQQVKSLATSCPEELQKGNVLAWPDFLPGVVGRVKIDYKSIFCADCPSLQGSIPHLRASSADVKPGSKVSLSCDPGFQIVGNSVQHCLNLGQWTRPFPRCERISCGVPPPLENGFYSAEDFFAGSIVTYHCNNGYYLLGDSRMLCLDNGSWSSISPSCLDVDECAVGSDCDGHASCLNTNGSYVCTCIPPYTGDGKKCAEPVKCRNPGNPEYGRLHGNTYSVGSEVTFSCEEGFQLTGVTKLKCMESGEWNHPIPYCEAVSCGGPVIPENSAILGSNFTYRSKVMYRCNDGYNLVGVKEIVCLASGVWNHPPPSCETVTCPTPQDISNGKYTLTGTTYLSSVSYACDNGYSLQGPSILVCASSGNWNGTPPACSIVSCGSPPTIKDAVINGNNFTFGNTVSYKCKEGYTLVGPAAIECLASGKWSVSHQQCLAVSCDEPPHVENASPESGHRLFGDIAYYFCSDGYSLADNSQLLCNAEGKWVPPEGREMPHCVADFCENPSTVSYSILESISKARFAAGSIVSFKCMEGFVLNTSAKIECLRGGQWNPSPLSIQCIPVRCGEPPHISNGYASGANYSFGAVVAYSCNKGFYIKGEKKRTCEATGNWSGSLPTCHPVSCGEPPQLENGFFKETGHFFEDQANYQCYSGYQLVGSSVFICQANRQWYSESPPYCAPLSCGKPPPIQHGYSKGEAFDMGSKVEFFCDEGYELTGDVSWTCQKSGKWNKKQSPKCVPTKCPEPPLAENQLVLREVTYQVGVVQFSCKEGFVLHGSSVLKCLPSQQWNDSFPFCKVVQCPAPPYIPFGDPLTSSLHFGSTVKYICVDGFLLKGESTIRCQADGSWSLPLPECIPVECPQPEEIQNGIVDVQGLTFLSTALYTCKPGFELVGNTTILCGEDGQWLGGRPACKPIQCQRPKKILNGKYSFTNFHYGQTVRYSCDRGFELQGEETLRCLETGEWSTEVPSCKAINCQPPQPIENGFVEGADYSYGAMVIYSCVPGFQLSGLAMQTCEESGWSSSTPACLPTDCGLPPHIDFGEYLQVRHGERRSDQESVTEHPSLSHTLLADSLKDFKSSSKEDSAMQLTTFLFGTIILYRCYSGYELMGNPVLACQEDGVWNGTAPACVSIECTLLSPPKNGFLHFTENTLGSIVQYTCKPGFTLVGSDTRLCLPSRQWSNTAPYCVAITCNSPPRLMNGNIRGENYTYGSVVYYECDPGYQLNGPTERRCQENQKWDGSEPICIPVSCSPPPVLENGQVTGDEYTFQRHTEYSCNEGFLLDGDRTRVCLANGSWSGIAPVCKAVTCPLPLPLPNGRISGSDFGFKKEVHYHCDKGYSLQGVSTLTCQSDGTWNSEAPHCEPVICGPPEDISHGFLNGSGFAYGEFAQYVCFPGYELHGNPLRQCLSNGSWSGSLPSCLPCLCPTPQIQNGVVRGTNFNCGQSVQFECLEGFKLLGPSEISCVAAGKWSSGFPHCGQISCGSPPIISNAFINGSSSADENTIIYTCLTGFVMQGSPELTCVETGVWKKPYPNCELLSCGPPPSVPNAEVLGNTYTYGSKVQYRCLEGYTMMTEMDVCICQEDGQWSPQSISCCPKKCPLPGNITRVIIPGDNFTMNTNITLSCIEGYTLEGASTSTCKESGIWVPPFSDDICIPVSCGTPETPEHGFVVGSKYNYNDVVLYKCDSGYDLQGDAERTCQEDKFWSGTVPACRRVSCGPPDTIENGSFQGEEFLFGSEVFYSCDPGFELQGPSRRICHVDKKWNPSAPSCTRINCGLHPSIEKAEAISTGSTYRSNVSFVCNSGYHLVGPQNITCLSNGSWSKPFPSCEETRCKVPVPLLNGKAIYENNTVGSTIAYFCEGGYSLEGEPEAECTRDGRWSNPLPLCKPNLCPVPFIIPENALLSEVDFYVGQNVSIRCREGYQLKGQSVITCNADETWTPATAKCEKISCGPPAHTENALIRGSFYQYGDMVTYSCYSGYMLEGPLRSVCLENGTWTTPPTCKAVCRFPCQNGGICERPNACSCPDGWMGRLCEEPICILPCLNGGRCVAPYQCDCPPGWTGSRCHTAVCQMPCLNGGKCIRPNRCYCPSSWTGHDCSRKRKAGFYPF